MTNSRPIFFYTIILSTALTACGQVPAHEGKSSKIPNHTTWDELLKKHVNSMGGVDYRGFIKDSTLLNAYLQELAVSAPNDAWAKNDQLAYWINLYNAATVKLITKHYPIPSIKGIGSSIQIPFVNTPWQIEFININDKLLDLDNIEHGIIRKKFDEPRIHFALVCGATSCPKLKNEAYFGEKLDQQLTDQAKSFLVDSTKNKIGSGQITISKLFKWYGGDFKKKSTLIEYLNQYSTIKIDKDADIDFMDYDWKLNEL